MRGPKPTPTVNRRLQGNPGRRPLNQHEPQHSGLDASFDVPPPEVAADKRAAAEWTRLAPMLRLAQQITEADRSALIALCVEWSCYLDAQARLQKQGMIVMSPSGYPITNPYVSVARSALGMCGKLWAELGLTPSSRSRVKTVGPGPTGDEFSEFDRAPAADRADVSH